MALYNKTLISGKRPLWPQTTLYEIVDAITEVAGADDIKLIEDIMINLFQKHQLRTTRTWARIKWEPSLKSIPDTCIACPA